MDYHRELTNWNTIWDHLYVSYRRNELDLKISKRFLKLIRF